MPLADSAAGSLPLSSWFASTTTAFRCNPRSFARLACISVTVHLLCTNECTVAEIPVLRQRPALRCCRHRARIAVVATRLIASLSGIFSVPPIGVDGRADADSNSVRNLPPVGRTHHRQNDGLPARTM